MSERLLQDETQTYDSKGLSRWFSSRLDARQRARDAAFDIEHGGRELLPIEQAAYEHEGAERFAKFHGHGRSFPQQAEIPPEPPITRAAASIGGKHT